MTQENEGVPMSTVRWIAVGWTAIVLCVLGLRWSYTRNDDADYNRGVEAGQQYEHEVAGKGNQAAIRPSGNSAFEDGVTDGIAWRDGYERRYDDCIPQWYPHCEQPQPPPPHR